MKAVESTTMAGDGASAATADDGSGPGDHRHILEAYSPDEHRPLAGYAALTAVFGAGFVAACVSLARRDEGLPERIPAGDIALMAVATQKLSRQITKDKATSFLRAPFARYSGSSGPSEVSEEPRGTGLRLAVGELLTCPFCIGQWVSAGMVWGYVNRPRATRMVGGVFTILSLADFLQLAYAAAQERA